MKHNINYYVNAINNIAEEDLIPIAELIIEAMDNHNILKSDKRKKRYRDYKKCCDILSSRIIKYRNKHE